MDWIKKKILIIYCENPLMERDFYIFPASVTIVVSPFAVDDARVNACQVMPLLCVSHYNN